mmetsp:Transcript_19476/g.21785  ORF Transcript_19476/g.21785 Transcript_19476/m.21785 type:complete len:382 (+) Transcript_19476:61-1206(+)|eukprot:CAMPEP_0205825010 /NCGR_PEP_ID=MMETSP0206-20130828/23523_1 /ASSEMBLY_ACC=CAM_ASM_000279 /TAXON_ID=36767 /ORGANISM="Euplotes focardii, Strain TN1" /LENGTH=381 /DNA_ID=CAMNT_0053123653 /DNA_START=60 /DNA_END=1205 /DNA_ORIENTATION=+
MGGGGSKEEDPDPSNNVELELVNQQIDELFAFKILLLGAGESGKSTIVKQLKLIHKKKITPKELKAVGTSLHQNVVDCMKALILACKNFGYELPDEAKHTEEIINNHIESERLTEEEGQALMELWQTEAIQNTYKRRNEFWLLDSFSYYIKNLDRFCQDDFVPTDEDSVMARIRTTGIVVTQLEQKIAKEHEDEPDQLVFQVVDVGGQRNERKKWMHCFDDVRAILFCVNLAGYDQVLFEDSSKNRMHESLELFQKVCNNKLFESTPIFLFLNKKDLFESMVKEHDMAATFEEYDGGMELGPALNYIQDQYKSRLPQGKEMAIQVVSASWKRDIRCAFEEVKKALYDMNRKTLIGKVQKLRKEYKSIEASQHKKNGGSGCC